MRGDTPLNEDIPVDGERLVVATFMKTSAAEALPTFARLAQGSKLYCGEGEMRVFANERRNTFIHVRNNTPDRDYITSIALDKISKTVQLVRSISILTINSDSLPRSRWDE